MQPRIVFVTPYPDSADLAASMAPAGFEFVPVAARSPEYADAIGETRFLVGFVAPLIDADLYRAAPDLALIQLLSAGYDSADIDAARAGGVPVANNGGANSVAVAEHALMLMLAVARRLPWQHASVAAGEWRGRETPRVFELRGRTLGLVGLGAIGKKVARLASAFGLHVVYYDTRRLTEDEEDALGVRFRLFGELLESADVISLHVPLNRATHHLVDAAALARMRPGAILVNTSRGALIDEQALIAALAEKRIHGAGLDVFETEPAPPGNPLFSLDNVVLTPHLAGPTFESHTARLRNAFDNVQRVARGETPLWVIPELRG